MKKSALKSRNLYFFDITPLLLSSDDPVVSLFTTVTLRHSLQQNIILLLPYKIFLFFSDKEVYFYFSHLFFLFCHVQDGLKNI